MAMDRIQGSSLTPHGALNNFSRTGKAEESGREEATSPAVERDSETGSKAGDTAEISAAGKQLVNLKQAVEVGKAALAALPDVRQDRVAEARERLSQGFYHSAAVRGRVAEKLVGILGNMEADPS